MEYVISEDYNVDWLAEAKVIKNSRKSCLDLISCFDIETTAIPEIEQSVMYIWQWIIGNKVYVGRTWADFKTLVDNIERVAPAQLIVYVHKLAYEISFLKGILNFRSEDIFVMKGRRVLKADYGAIQFRCSYMLTNLSLGALCKQLKPEHVKTEMSYDELRFSDTKLTDEEFRYCIMDVISLAECLTKLLKENNDTLLTVPLTATGYARKDARSIFLAKAIC